jgi:hypothetical protein
VDAVRPAKRVGEARADGERRWDCGGRGAEVRVAGTGVFFFCAETAEGVWRIVGPYTYG